MGIAHHSLGANDACACGAVQNSGTHTRPGAALDALQSLDLQPAHFHRKEVPRLNREVNKPIDA
jgi:hypothetical protein